jgi:hypothetical protein
MLIIRVMEARGGEAGEHNTDCSERGVAVCNVFLIQMPGEGLGKLCSVAL